MAMLDSLIALRTDDLAAATALEADGDDLLPPRSSWLRGGSFAELCEAVPLSEVELVILLAVVASQIDDRLALRLERLAVTSSGTPTGGSGVSIDSLRNLTGRTVVGRQRAVHAMDPRGLLHQARLVEAATESTLPGPPRLRPTTTAVELLAGVMVSPPELAPDFPATPLTTVHRLDDVVVTPSIRRRIDDALARVRNQHLVLDSWGIATHHDNVHGLTMLLHGPPGTGKTMTAAAMAVELGIPALRVDLSSLVSKYIGETAKNLERVFRYAEGRRCLLFFDEADSVFGRRGEVNDARDRYANQEVSYLLQRIEQFPGIVVLATNLLANIDQAFTRRMDVVLELSAPNVHQRVDLWQRVYPATVPCSDIPFDTLAEQYQLTGAQIRDAAVDAAFHAAANGGTVTTQHLERAIKRQFTKSGLMVPV